MTSTLADRPRLELEDALAALCDADQHAHAAALRLTNRARTEEEADIIREIIAVRNAIRRARDHVAACHPQGRSDT